MDDEEYNDGNYEIKDEFLDDEDIDAEDESVENVNDRENFKFKAGNEPFLSWRLVIIISKKTSTFS